MLLQVKLSYSSLHHIASQKLPLAIKHHRVASAIQPTQLPVARLANLAFQITL